ncbi:MAG TPA: Rrf2 family transcriptional regulator [Bacteroidales bacterium]|nr:Rrf2 family transcriptional regulator [Bacteroidales bacterium]
MNFTKTTFYSFSILAYMAQNKDVVVSASHIHEKLNIPYFYLRTLLNELKNHNLLTVERGRNGGFSLARDKSHIFLSEIIAVTEGHDPFAKCIMGFTDCPLDKRCYMHDKWIKVKSELLDILKKTSLDDLK